MRKRSILCLHNRQDSFRVCSFGGKAITSHLVVVRENHWMDLAYPRFFATQSNKEQTRTPDVRQFCGQLSQSTFHRPPARAALSRESPQTQCVRCHMEAHPSSIQKICIHIIIDETVANYLTAATSPSRREQKKTETAPTRRRR